MDGNYYRNDTEPRGASGGRVLTPANAGATVRWHVTYERPAPRKPGRAPARSMRLRMIFQAIDGRIAFFLGAPDAAPSSATGCVA